MTRGGARYRLLLAPEALWARRAAGAPPLRNGGRTTRHRASLVTDDGAPLVPPEIWALLGVEGNSVLGLSPQDAARRGHAYARRVADKAAAALPVLVEDRACLVRRAARAALRADEDSEADALFYAREIAQLDARVTALRRIVAQVGPT